MKLQAAARLAVAALAVNRLRTGLAMLGVVIGVAAVVTMMSVGAGARARVESEIRSLGSNLIIVISGTITAGGVRLGTGSEPTLTEDDARAMMREIGVVQAAAPMVRGGAQVVAGNANWSTAVFGVTPEFLDAREWGVVSGRPLVQGDVDAAAKVALIGQTVAQNLFGSVDPTGQVIRVAKASVLIVGVLDRKGQSSQGQDQDDVVLVPISTAKKKVLGSTRASARAVGTILVKVTEPAAMTTAEDEIRSLLRQRHRLSPAEGDDFTIRNLSDLLASQEAASRVLAVLLAAIASVSLVVGGIGIMNIMLVSVTERTREIGLRRAVGARRRDVLAQFLTEAMVISLTGGILGVALGALGSWGIARFAGWPAPLTASAVVPAVLFAAMVGMFFGFYPARKASRLNPVDALRYE